MNNSDTKRELLRHTLATLAYRGGKAVRDTNDSYASFKASETTRTPAQILAHVGDLLDWALSIAFAWHFLRMCRLLVYPAAATQDGNAL